VTKAFCWGATAVAFRRTACRRLPTTPAPERVRTAATYSAMKSRTKATRPAKASPRTDAASKAVGPPPFQPVQLAALVDTVPTGDRWVHEMKYDGYRTLLAVGSGAARAYTRSGLDWSTKFGVLIEAAVDLVPGSALIDGEAVVLDAAGRSSFQSLQAALKADPGSVVYYAFDLLSLDGEDLRGLPLIERKARLKALIPKTSRRILYSDHFTGGGEKLLETFCAAGLEGVVSKTADGRYVGSRAGSWVKTKCIQRQEFAIVGWTPSDKARGFRSLILAVNDQDGLRYAGKVGTGFDAAEMNRLVEAMAPLATQGPTVKAPGAAVRDAQWLKPRLVAEIAFTEVTSGGVLRHPSYLGLRDDKRAEAVVMEKAASPIGVDAPSPVAISNRDRILYPESSITKGQLADHYEALAPIILPWLGSRPMSLVRCPQGRARKCFFQKHDAGSFGSHVHHVAITEKDGHEEPYLYVDDPNGLMSCVQMGTIEFHGWGARIEDVEKADRLVFDLDPDVGLDFEAVRSAAFHFRDLLEQLGLETFAMVTGGKGVHVIAPLTPEAEWQTVKDFARRVALVAAQKDPARFTAALPKAQRKGRIFVDYLRNQRGATAVMPYCVRAREGAPVAAPITWEEMASLKGPARWHVGDAAELAERARSKAMADWGRASQVLPDL